MKRTLHSVIGNSQRLDGGAMFGNVPKVLWQKWAAPDAANTIALACRGLVVQEPSGKNLLLETGIGASFEPKLKERFGVVEHEHVLLSSLERLGLRHEDIDVVVLSHLHFDHAGGLLAPWAPDTAPGLLFPKARFVVSAEAWARARRPHQRDRASFIAALPRLLESSGRLTVVQGPGVPGCLGAGYRLHYSQGHTPGLMLTEVEMPGGPVVFCGDLIPGTPWVHLPITMGYDRYPELLIDEKEQILGDLLRRGGRLFYTHDTHVAMSGLAQDGNGRYQATDPLAEVIGLQD